MAEAITNIVHSVKTEAELENERLNEVRKQTATDAEGLIDGLKLLQAMHERGVLELLAALFERGDKVLNSLMDILEQPGATRTLKTLMSGMQALGQIDAAAIQKVTDGWSSGVENTRRTPIHDKPLGVFELMRQLKDPDVNAAMQTGLAFLKGVGQSIRKERKEGDPT